MSCMLALVMMWGFWVACVVAVMAVDRSLHQEDFAPSMSPYFALAVVTPFLVLPVYFYSAHRSGTAGVRWGLTVAGIPLTCVCWVLAAVHGAFWITAVNLLALA